MTLSLAPQQKWREESALKQCLQVRQITIKHMVQLPKLAAARIAGGRVFPAGGVHAIWDGLLEGV